jgi:hypothetical protein
LVAFGDKPVLVGGKTSRPKGMVVYDDPIVTDQIETARRKEESNKLDL